VRIVLILLIPLSLIVSKASADDFGPPHDVAAVRRDIMSMLGDSPAHLVWNTLIDNAPVPQRSPSGNQLRISDVVIVGDWAVASYAFHTSNAIQTGFLGLHKIDHQWWLLSRAVRGADYVSYMFTNAPPLAGAPGSAQIGYGPDVPTLERYGFPHNLAVISRDHNAQVAEAQRACEGSPKGRARNCDVETVEYEWYEVHHLISRTGSGIIPDPGAMGGYDVRLQFAPSDAQPGTEVSDFSGRSPAHADDPGASYFFTLRIQSAHPVNFAGGSALEIWFPHLLDSKTSYVLNLQTDKGGMFDALPGVLQGNILSFALPEFTAQAGEEFRDTVRLARP